MHVRFLVAVALAGALASTACKGPTDPSKNKTETLTGTVGQSAFSLQTFSAGNNGEYFLTLQSLTPPLQSTSFTTGIRVTAVVSGQCVFGSQIVGDNQLALPGMQALSGLIDAGQYCLWVYDAGFFSTTETYVVQISHP